MGPGGPGQKGEGSPALRPARHEQNLSPPLHQVADTNKIVFFFFKLPILIILNQEEGRMNRQSRVIDGSLKVSVFCSML